MRFSVAAATWTKIKPATIRLRAVLFMHALKDLPDDAAERCRIDAEFLEVAGARTTTGFDRGADGIGGAQRSECAAQEAGVD